MAETERVLTMDELVTGLGDLRATVEGESRDVCQAAANVLYALSEEGVKTPEDVLDILHDYRLQAKQIATLSKKYLVAGRPILKDSVWHCPSCNRRVSTGHSFCHRCGKKLGWK